MEENGKSSNRYKTLKLSMLIAGLSVLLFSKTFLAVIPAAGQEVEVSVNAPEEVEAGESFDVTIDIRDVTDFNSGQFELSFDSSVVEVTDLSEGSIDGETISELLWKVVDDADTVHVSVYMPMGVGLSGSGHLAEVGFKVTGEEGDRSVLDISNGSLFDNREMGFTIFKEFKEEFKHELNNEEISDDLKKLFEDNKCLLENPIVKVIKKDEQWKIIDRRVYSVRFKKGAIDVLDKLDILNTGEIVETEWVDAEIRVGEEKDEEEKEEFDIGPGTYPSISGRHEGKIEVYKDVAVEKLYTYHCIGTGGHAEHVKIWNDSWSTESAWSGYTGDWYNISFSEPFVLYAGEPYSYIIETGSYPQIIHKQNHTALYERGIISCDKFVDANGRTYNDWIPAIKLW
jgi:hypothetical protein